MLAPLSICRLVLWLVGMSGAAWPSAGVTSRPLLPRIAASVGSGSLALYSTSLLYGGTRATPISALRGEVGASLMKSRIMESKIKLIKSMMTSDNEMVREVANKVLRDGDSSWNKLLKKYMEEVGMGMGDLELG